MMDNFGIDFNKWEENLKAIEKENKIMVKFEKEKYRQEDKRSKNDQVKQTKEEEELEYEKNKQEVSYTYIGICKVIIAMQFY